MAVVSLDQIADRIIKEQELIIGPVAWSEARKVRGLEINGGVHITADPKEVLNNLVAQYRQLFGRASDEVCKHAVASLLTDLPVDQIPSSLR